MEHSDSKTGDNEIVRALHRLSVETGSLACLGCGREHNCNTHGCAMLRDAANLIESLQAQLAESTALLDSAIAGQETLQQALTESQRREQAAVEELIGICGQIDEDGYLRKAFCIHPGREDCPSEAENGYVDVDDCVGCPLFENSWRGPQEAREGGQSGA